MIRHSDIRGQFWRPLRHPLAIQLDGIARIQLIELLRGWRLEELGDAIRAELREERHDSQRGKQGLFGV